MKNLSCTKYILYGGTFDPPHLGHVTLLEWVQQQLQPQQICVLPSYCPVRSVTVTKNTQATFAQRLAMCHLAFAPLLTQANFNISRLEADLSSPSYSIHSIEYFYQLLQKNGQTPQLAFLLGEDQFLQFRHWHRAADIINMCSLYVIPRDTSLTTKSWQSSCQDLAQALGWQLAVNATNPERYAIVSQQQQQELWLLRDFPQHPAQSSSIRAACRRGDLPFLQTALPTNVLQYIQTHRLYDFKEATK